jgi:hypothetical protein
MRFDISDNRMVRDANRDFDGRLEREYDKRLAEHEQDNSIPDDFEDCIDDFDIDD